MGNVLISSYEEWGLYEQDSWKKITVHQEPGALVGYCYEGSAVLCYWEYLAQSDCIIFYPDFRK